jgi:hypothetical protein
MDYKSPTAVSAVSADVNAEKPWRNERVHIHRREANPGKGDYQWKVTPGMKIVTPGQTLRWEAFRCKQLKIDLPGEVFSLVSNEGNKAVAIVKDAPDGAYHYRALCDGEEAIGDSAPGVIIDRS